MPVAEGRELLTLQEASERFNLPMTKLRYWLTTKDISRFKRGDGRVLVDPEDVKRMIEKRSEVRPAE